MCELERVGRLESETYGAVGSKNENAESVKDFGGASK